MEKRGDWMTSASAPVYLGTPSRTGMWKISSPSSIMPGMTEEPPVRTMPEESTSSKLKRRSSAWISS